MPIGSPQFTIQSLDALDNQNLVTELKNCKEELFKLRFQKATGQLETHGRIKAVRRDIARIKTVLTERKLKIRTAPQSVAVDKKSVDKKPADKKSTDKKIDDKKTVDKKSVDKKSTDKKTVDKKVVVKKSSIKESSNKKSVDESVSKQSVSKKPIVNKPSADKKLTTVSKGVK
jgi:large subunit ribosomal protein L29